MANLLYSLLWKVDTCCGCDLRKGAKVILWIEFICSAFMTVLSIAYLLLSDQRFKEVPYRSFDGAIFNSLVVNNLVFGLLPSILAWWGDRKNYPSWLRLYIIIHILDIIRFSAIMLLEYFIWISHKKEPDVIEMFIILSYGSSEVFYVLCVVIFEGAFKLGHLGDTLFFFFAVNFYVMRWYWVSVIYKHHLNMKGERNEEPLPADGDRISVLFSRMDG